MPRFLGGLLPAGLLGLLVAAMLAAEMSTDSGYMLAWGSVIYNDVLAPLRRGRPWSEKTGILWNRAIVALIGVYLFVFGLWYRPTGDVWSYLVLSAAIYTSSMAVMVVACCYWPRANNWGALGAILFGSVTPATFLVLEKLPATAEFAARIGPNIAGLVAFGTAAAGMVIGSLLKPGSRATALGGGRPA
jgi:SSS family solute:Na+ symporter